MIKILVKERKMDLVFKLIKNLFIKVNILMGKNMDMENFISFNLVIDMKDNLSKTINLGMENNLIHCKIKFISDNLNMIENMVNVS